MPEASVQTELNRLKEFMSMMARGVSLSGVAEVKERGPRTYNGETSEVMILEAHGFSQTFYADKPEQYKDWPQKGEWIAFSTAVQRGKDGKYSVGNLKVERNLGRLAQLIES